jgi:hypothetical protein
LLGSLLWKFHHCLPTMNDCTPLLNTIAIHTGFWKPFILLTSSGLKWYAMTLVGFCWPDHTFIKIPFIKHSSITPLECAFFHQQGKKYRWKWWWEVHGSEIQPKPSLVLPSFLYLKIYVYLYLFHINGNIAK